MASKLTYAILSVGGIATAAMLSLGTGEESSSVADDVALVTNEVALVATAPTADSAVAKLVGAEVGAVFPALQQTSITNLHYVTKTSTNFEQVAVSPSQPAYFAGTGEATRFLVTTRNASDCRVSVDPVAGLRSNMKLTIDRSVITTNNVSVWSNVCVVTDLSVEEVSCSFATNYCYRFAVDSVATNGEYLVAIGAEGVQCTFEPYGGKVKSDALSTSLTFNWTLDTPIGYLPPLTNDVQYGTYSWDYSPDYSVTDPVSVTNSVDRDRTTMYAHWSKGVVVPLVFDWNLTNSTSGVSTNVVCTNYFLRGVQVNLYNASAVTQPSYGDWGFLGWTTNSAGTLGWDMGTITVSNSVTFYAQWTREWQTSRTADGLSIDGYIGTLPAELEIPSFISPCPKQVVAIGGSAFAECTDFTTLYIPSGVTSIGDSAFEGCTSLTTVTFPSVYPDDEASEEGFLTDEIELGVAAFAGCTSLVSVELPLGVMRLPDEIFSGCTALRSFTMPYTVDEIGTMAFYGCKYLNTVCCSEVVDGIESEAFGGCTRLRQVQFLGWQPSEVEGDIFSGTHSDVLVGYFENMKETCSEYCGGDWPVLPGTWPSGSYARKLTWLDSTLYKRYKVSFNYNKDHAPGTSTITPRIYIAGRVFGLLAPTSVDMDDGFVGWYTKPIGGEKIGDYREINESLVVYAHWDSSSESGAETGSRGADVRWDDFEYSALDAYNGFYSSDDDTFYYAACTFNGIVVDADKALAGTITVKFKAGTYSETDGGLQSAFTAVITWNAGGTTTLSGVVNADGEIVYEHGDVTLSAKVTKSGLCGALVDGSEDGGEYAVYAARNRYAMSSTAARSVVLPSLQVVSGKWQVSVAADGLEESILTVAFSGYGKAKVSGVLSDGDRVSVSSTLIAGDGCSCLPVMVGSGTEHEAFSFMMWFTWQSDGSVEVGEDVTIEGASGCTAEICTDDDDEE